MKKILIKWLGGYTENEVKIFMSSNYDNGVADGKSFALASLKDYADRLYGKPADSWCKLMYNKICNL